MRRIALILAATALTAAATDVTNPTDTAATAPLPYTQEQADSCVTAFATVMASYCLPEIHKNYPDDPEANTQFARGVAEAFEINGQKSAYYMGVRTGLGMIERVATMGKMGYPITPENFTAAVTRALNGDTMGFTGETADAYLHRFMNILNPPPAPLTDESQQAFLDAQTARDGVQELPSGLLFEILTEGEGQSPAATDRVKVTYTGRLADGTVFDETEKAITVPVSGLVKGFSEGLQLMKPGGTYRIFIPAALGYADKGAADVIPPNAALDFTVTLLEVLPSQPRQ